MTRLKIIRTNREERKRLLQAKLSTSLVDDINLMCQWSGNDKGYVIAELLRYALSMEPDFQAYKQSIADANSEAMRKHVQADNRHGTVLPIAK